MKHNWIFFLLFVLIFLIQSNTFAISSSQRDTILSFHNFVREKFSLPALVWDTGIEKQAQNWANILAKNNVFKHSDFKYNKGMGENLYAFSTTGKKIYSDGSDAVNQWSSEWKNYNFDTYTCNPGFVCGHFTQIIWKNTKRIGCGQSIGKKGGIITVYWVCQYDPPGNFLGESPY